MIESQKHADKTGFEKAKPTKSAINIWDLPHEVNQNLPKTDAAKRRK